MTIERKIKINNRDYFLGIELKYNTNNMLRKFNGGYFDMGDLSIMIEEVQSNYLKESKIVIYDKSNSYMNDIIYLYDRFPFISYIREILYNDEGEISFISIINKDEITSYIKTNNIQLNRWDKDNCRCPLLYE